MKINKLFYIFIVFVLNQINTYSQVYESSDLYFEEAKRDIAAQNYTKAAKMSWRGLQLAPNDIDLKALLGKSNLELGRYDTARYVLKQAYLKRRKDIEILQNLVKVEHITKRYSDAICFVNELLEITPYNRGWWIRKINIYKEMGNSEEAERALKRLYQLYPNDTEIENEYNYIRLGDAKQALDSRNFKESNQIYKTIIDRNPENREAYLGVIRNELAKGNPEAALQYTNRSLKQMPDDLDLIQKKIGLLEELGRHAEAISYIRTDEEVKNKAKYKDIHSRTLPYLMQQSASFNDYNDSYEVNKKLVELNGNSESQDYVINNALGKGYDVDAEYFLKKSLKNNPNNKKRRIQLMELYKPVKTRENYEREVLKNHESFPNDSDITFAYNNLMFKRGQEYVAGRQFDKALPIFKDLTSFPDFTKEAEQQIFGIYLELDRLDEASDQIDKLISLDSENPDHLLSKSTLYQRMGLFDDALNITRSLEQQYPLSLKYPSVYVDQVEAYATVLMKEQRYSKVLPVIEDGLTRENNNKRLLEIAINAASAIPDYQRGVNYSKSALTFYPKSKNFKLKLSSLLAQNKQYDEAISVLDSLKTIYKYDRKIKNSLAEVLWYKAKNQEEEGLIDEALVDYNSSDTLNPSENYSLQRMINLYIIQKPNEEALEIINQKLEKYPNDNFLKFKKGLVYELMKEYDSAHYYQSFRVVEDPYEKQQWAYTLSTLKAAKLKNKLVASYTKATSDSIAFSTSIASLGYSHKYDSKNTFGADVNYAARRSGVGVQGGLNYSRIFSPTLYADAGFLLGNRFFPKLNLFANAYKGLKNGYEAQVGLSYARLQNDQNYLTLKLGAAKSWEDITLNARLSLMNTSLKFINSANTDNFFYTNLMVSAQINVNARNDYFSIIASGGSAPFDQQLEFQSNTFLNFTNIMIGAGYNYHLTPRTSLLVNGTWINFQSNQTTVNSVITEAFFTNQYNLSVTLITQF